MTALDRKLARDLVAMGGQIVGMVEVTVSARPLLERLRILPGQEQLRWVLLNNQGRYLADSNSLQTDTDTNTVAQNTYC